ncbi:hypothetical protein [Roseiterribacter gracilis]|uniref:Uncharacterized protein n=1 Tax=Roseiterribacter gracilis TaxID=2812848 RepID=A0A8S8XJU3_9PROT|nr:hypothetical protein TMPK1_36920 [Rhodospirillales bacterium TMPK1]
MSVLRIGLDFDNTIASYDELFLRLATREGLLAPDFAGDKRAVRDAVRVGAGDGAWQLLQGRAYGREIAGAKLYDGVIPFLETACAAEHELFVVSHKTQFGHGDDVDLRHAALDWMETVGLFDAGRTGLSRDRVFFGATRDEKLARIGALGLGIFVDDLPEVLLEPTFPSATERWLFDPGGRHVDTSRLRPFQSWAALRDALAGTRVHG